MRHNAEIVLKTFALGQSAESGSISTNGREVFSYKTVIARRESDGSLSVLSRKSSISHTTSTHLTAVLTMFAEQAINIVDTFDPIE